MTNWRSYQQFKSYEKITVLSARPDVLIFPISPHHVTGYALHGEVDGSEHLILICIHRHSKRIFCGGNDLPRYDSTVPVERNFQCGDDR